jgi:hypothetical protein
MRIVFEDGALRVTQPMGHNPDREVCPDSIGGTEKEMNDIFEIISKDSII